ncbi:uncharacterized protein RSE6_13711 [Rhynchosporium secalis]|uniref:Uncharacterized protein n=1 Tax=Rhynchosporium secalis TaxID=38038 RepID=A0A1E1MTJ0_RHYSE|nr:uncharacterized protein RSE6_13711 [Rhynchosporium secalis]
MSALRETEIDGEATELPEAFKKQDRGTGKVTRKAEEDTEMTMITIDFDTDEANHFLQLPAV